MPNAQQSGALGGAASGASGGGGDRSNSIVIDLSSMGGLAQGYWGDSDQTTTLPQRKMNINENQLAEGFFNPWLRQGYLSPAVSTTQAMSYSGTSPVAVLSATEYDAVNDTLYFSELGGYFYSASGYDGFTLTSRAVHATTTAMVIDDMQMYELDGVRYLFLSYQLPSDTVTFNTSVPHIYGTLAYPAIGTPVTFTVSGGSLPTGISAGTTYYIISVGNSGFFNVSATSGGSAVAWSTNGSGTITMHGAFGSIAGFDLSSGLYSNLLGGNTSGQVNYSLTNNPHLLRLGNDGYMYIFDGNTVHRFDGSVLGGTY